LLTLAAALLLLIGFLKRRGWRTVTAEYTAHLTQSGRPESIHVMYVELHSLPPTIEIRVHSLEREGSKAILYIEGSKVIELVLNNGTIKELPAPFKIERGNSARIVCAATDVNYQGIFGDGLTNTVGS